MQTRQEDWSDHLQSPSLWSPDCDQMWFAFMQEKVMMSFVMPDVLTETNIFYLWTLLLHELFCGSFIDTVVAIFAVSNVWCFAGRTSW